MFLTSSAREIVPITSANGSAIGDGRPGPITLMLLNAYRSAVEQLILED
jgi:branched-subunit amino acid aminotransferase/4-amino-4-deoxychorismate lyase